MREQPIRIQQPIHFFHDLDKAAFYLFFIFFKQRDCESTWCHWNGPNPHKQKVTSHVFSPPCSRDVACEFTEQKCKAL